MARKSLSSKSKRTVKKTQSWTKHILSGVFRLFVYYLIYLSLWKCPPPTLLTEDSPSLCKPLHNVFDLASPHISPYIEPINAKYSLYAQPYIEKAKPYVQKGLNNSLYAYYSHVHPSVLKAADKAHAVIIAPYQGQIILLHQQHIQPLYDRASQFYSKNVAGYIDKSCSTGRQAYANYVVPSYKKVQPHFSKASENVKSHIYPKIQTSSAKLIELVLKYFTQAKEWFTHAVEPKVKSVYQDAVEPQINKIFDRVVPNRGDSEESIIEEEKIIVDVSEITDIIESTSVVASVAEITESETALESTPSSTPSTPFSTPSTPPISTDETIPQPSLQFEDIKKYKSISISSELSKWKDIVERTTLEAFSTFLDDVEQEKHNLMEATREEFTTLLQKLSKDETDAYKELDALVASIENTEDDDETVSPALIQAEFRRHADIIRGSAMAIREKAEQLAAAVLNRTEEIRRITIDILDEFADASLQEISRKMVSIDSSSPTASDRDGGDTVPNWRNWKEFRNLKDRLLSSRQDIIDHDINMADVNKMLREAQETANLLAKESAHLLSGLRSKADYNFQIRLSKKNKRDEELGKTEDETPQDAEIYEELEDEVEVEHTTITQTIFHTFTQVTTEPSPESTSVLLNSSISESSVETSNNVDPSLDHTESEPSETTTFADNTPIETTSISVEAESISDKVVVESESETIEDTKSVTQPTETNEPSSVSPSSQLPVHDDL